MSAAVTAESWMRRIDALGHHVAKAMPESDDEFYARLDRAVEHAKHMPPRRRELDPAVEADAVRMDTMIEAELRHVERRMRDDLYSQGASAAWCEKNIAVAIPVLRATRHAWRDRILWKMRGGR